MEKFVENMNERETKFCEYYSECLNAKQSALKAGYSPKSARNEGYRLLKKEKIQKRVNELSEVVQAKIKIENIINKHIEIAMADIGDFVEWGNRNGKNFLIVKDSKKLDTSLVAEVSRGKDGLKIKLKDSHKSLEYLDKLLSRFTTNIELNSMPDLQNYFISLLGQENIPDQIKLSVLDKILKLFEIKQEDIDNQAQRENLQAFLEASKINADELEAIRNEITKEND